MAAIYPIIESKKRDKLTSSTDFVLIDFIIWGQ